MRRNHYELFSDGQIGRLVLPNRLVRSATWDPLILHRRAMSEEVLEVYQRLGAGGVGLVITGGLTVYRESLPDQGEPAGQRFNYADLRVAGIEQLAAAVHEEGNGCQVVAQLEAGYLNAGPSDYPSPFRTEPLRTLSVEEIHQIAAAFVDAAVDLQAAGFDGVQLHAAHGGLLSTFLSPYTNQRQDAYGGSIENRVRIVREIVAGIRDRAGDYPILIKLNGTDYLPDGIDAENFPTLAAEVARAGVDAIEVSGGMWECLVRPEAVLGFRPVPSPESHTRIRSPGKQSYFLPYAAKLKVGIPVILVGGNRDVERLEEILQRGEADFIAMSRPLIREPDLPNRWRAGAGSRLAKCISCNSCLYEMYMHPGRTAPGVVRCVCSSDKALHRQAQKWLAGWVRENVPAGLTFVPLDQAGFATLKSWFSDPELKRRFEVPTPLWFEYVTQQPNVSAWMIQEKGFPVGHLQLDIDEEQTGYIGFYVKPELRHQGFGRRILRAFLARPEAAILQRIVATAEVDNLASHRCLEAVGFVRDGNEPDEQGFFRYFAGATNHA